MSVRQPWAWLIVNGWKPVENRTWRSFFRGRFMVHASKGMSRAEYQEVQDFMREFTMLQLPAFEALPLGGIVGEVRMVDCVDSFDSPWFCGPWGFVLKDAKPLPFVPCRGALGFFEVEEGAGRAMAAMAAQW